MRVDHPAIWSVFFIRPGAKAPIIRGALRGTKALLFHVTASAREVLVAHTFPTNLHVERTATQIGTLAANHIRHGCGYTASVVTKG